MSQGMWCLRKQEEDEGSLLSMVKKQCPRHCWNLNLRAGPFGLRSDEACV